VRARVKRLIEHVLRTEAIDLIHFHGIDFHQYLPRTQRPQLATLHLPARLYPRDIFSERADRLFLHCVSQSQHRTCPGSNRLLPPIPNGVRLDHFIPRYEKQAYLLAMGRICPEKGYHLALEAAHAADVPLLLAGRVFPYPDHLKYFEERLVPLFDDRRRFIGPLGLAERARLLAHARCLLIPSLIEETSSLVAMEALASATPVIATRQGALPEVIENGGTGILVNDLAEMVAAIRTIDRIEPRTCRKEAESRFSAHCAFERYVSLYQHMVGSIANVG
jgi:glycosyltransferase involved in cell wall biosynthesis